VPPTPEINGGGVAMVNNKFALFNIAIRKGVVVGVGVDERGAGGKEG